MNSIINKYRHEIDGLRAFAVLTVIVNHFNKDLLPSGYLGVDIFFVISGYVITSSLNGRKNNSFPELITDFYGRRVKRLIPALVFFVVFTSIFICIFNPEPIVALKTGFFSLFGISNVYLFSNSTEYFSQSTQLNPFTHTWSLGVEEQFYLLFPFLIWFTGYGRQARQSNKRLLYTNLLLSIISFLLFNYLYTTNLSAAYFLMPARFWEMASGSIAFLILQNNSFFKNIVKKISSEMLILAIFLTMFSPLKYGNISTLLIVFLTILLIGSLRKTTFLFKVFTNRYVRFIGLISYSLYLWHWGILALSRWTIGVSIWSFPIQIFAMF